MTTPLSAARAACLACSLPALAPLALAQQFVEVPGLLPGPNQWTEGVELADIDQDGDLDIFWADGDGFASAGVLEQNRLHVNQLIETGSLGFTDDSIARLGVRSSHAKMVFTGDVDGDGWIDAMYANAYNTSRPFLYMNRGAVQPGFFDEEGVARGFSAVGNSASGQFGDLDDDGDLDLILNHSGASYFGGAGGQPRLYLNDGAGNFTQQGAANGWNPPNKDSQMDVQLVDIDNDMDLDFFGVCRGSNAGGNHYLMLNDGDAAFTDVSNILPGTSTSVYEAEVGDLDNDGDLDIFFTSLVGFNEGIVRNNLVENGALGFVSSGTFGGADDNEVVFLDYDNDGDFDPLVGSLGGTEALYRNDGSLSVTNVSNLIQSIGDPTLDATVGDLDNDGDYDLVTGQGEFGNHTNRYYRNDGPADTRDVQVVAVDPPLSAEPVNGPWIVKAKVRDAVIDDNVNYLSGVANYIVRPAPSVASVTILDGAYSPADITVPAGTSVVWTSQAGALRSVNSDTDPYTWASGNLLPGQSYERCFVVPGVYDYSTTFGGFAGTVTVTGPAESSVPGVYVGGQMFRFAMTGTAPAGSQLVWELEFTDGVGNTSIEACGKTPVSQEPGGSFCFGDGGDQVGCTDCPCANNAPLGSESGCLNTAGRSALLVASGVAEVSADSLRIEARDASSSTFGVLISGDNQLPANMANPCFGTGSGVQSAVLDGLRCAGGAVQRHGSRATDASGDIGLTNNGWGPPNGPAGGLIAQGGFVAGQTRNYQIFYRDLDTAGCMTGQNTTQGYVITFGP